MTKFKIPGRDCVGCSQSSFTDALEFFEEGVSLGEAGQVDFVGDGVTAVKSGSKVTVTIPGSEGGTFEIVDYEDIETSGLPTGISAGYIARIVCDENFSLGVDGVQYTNNTIIYYTGTHWISWSGNYGAPS